MLLDRPREGKRLGVHGAKDAVDLQLDKATFQGTACWHKGQSQEILTQARGYFERALARDPGNVDALLGAAWTDAMRGIVFLSDDGAQHLAAAETAATKVLSLAPITHSLTSYWVARKSSRTG